jgi:hypothetical protein
MYDSEDRLTVKEVKSIINLLQIGLDNSYDTRGFTKTAISSQDIMYLIKGDNK